jgi:hypothetical protein
MGSCARTDKVPNATARAIAIETARITFKILPPTRISYGAHDFAFQIFTLDCTNQSLDATLWAGARVGPEKSLAVFSFLQLSSVSVLEVVMNIRPKLFQLVAESVDPHLHRPTGKTRVKTTIGGRVI